MEDFDDNEYIENKFEEFKERNHCNADIFIERGTNNFSFSNENGDDCMSVLFDPEEKHMIIEGVQHCGISISLLLQFIREVILDYKKRGTPIRIEINDASEFVFVNKEKIQKVSLPILYKLSEGFTYYNKYLDPTRKLGYPMISILFFKENAEHFNKRETSLIKKTINTYSSSTIGEFFMGVRDWMKRHSGEGGEKEVDSTDWSKLVAYIRIINKTYAILNPSAKGSRRKIRRGRKTRKR